MRTLPKLKPYDELEGFRPSELLLPYHQWVRVSEEREKTLRETTKKWLYDWRMWDLACSPMNDEERRQIRYGYYMGWHAKK